MLNDGPGLKTSVRYEYPTKHPTNRRPQGNHPQKGTGHMPIVSPSPCTSRTKGSGRPRPPGLSNPSPTEAHHLIPTEEHHHQMLTIFFGEKTSYSRQITLHIVHKHVPAFSNSTDFFTHYQQISFFESPKNNIFLPTPTRPQIHKIQPISTAKWLCFSRSLGKETFSEIVFTLEPLGRSMSSCAARQSIQT